MRTTATRFSVPCALALACLWFAVPAAALVPTTVGVEGLLLSSGGGPAADGDYAVTFAIYKDVSGGAAVWSEGPVTLTVKSGQFVHALGSKTALTQQVLATAGAQSFLGVRVGIDPEFARKPLNSVTTALRAAVAENIDCSGCIGLGQLDATALVDYAKVADLSKVATTGKFSDLQGGPDLSAYVKMVSLATVALSGAYADLSGIPDLSVYAKSAALHKVATTGKYADLVDAPVLAAVAKSGSYKDLIDQPTLPKLGDKCGTGLVMRGILANGAYDCVVALDPAALPGDGLNEISNGLITNEFADSASGGTGVKIPDNSPVGVSDIIDFPDVGLAKKLTINIDITNSKINTVTVYLYDPANQEYVLHQKSSSGTSLKTGYPTPTSTASGDLSTWLGKNPKGKWFLKVVDNDFLNNTTDGQINAWSISIETLSSKKVQVKGDLLVDGGIKVGADATACTAAKAGTQRYANDRIEYCNGLVWLPVGASGATYRWAVWSSYDQSCCWFGAGGNGNAALFGGVTPQAWGDGSGFAGQMSADKEVLRTLFTNKGYAQKNATVWAESWYTYSSTNSKHAGALFRIRNTTGSAITWTPYAYMTSYAGWGNYASVALNGTSIWNSGGNNYYSNSTFSWNLSIPANRVSTAIFISANTAPSGTATTFLAFYNNSLALPAGLVFVDDMDFATGGWEQ
jgi:subtilisin-like proprotein convertase family protein